MYKLEEVVNAFESWRLNRLKRNEPIPERLWDMAKSLMPHYKKAHIQKALRLSGGQFNTRCLKQTNCETVRIKDRFVGVEILSLENKEADKWCGLTLKGERKSLDIRINIKQLPEVLPLIEGYL
jgi:hypothetical protein